MAGWAGVENSAFLHKVVEQQVHMGLDRVAVRTLERRVAVQHGLDEVVAGRQLVDRFDGIPAHAAVEHRRLARCEVVDVGVGIA